MTCSPSIKGWLCSLPKVLLLPVGAWMLLPLMAMGGEFTGSLFVVGFGAAIGMGIHFTSYLCMGIPIYILYWEKNSLIWEWPFAVPLGVILGILALASISLAIHGRFGDFDLILGSIYGGLTAIGACWSRKAR